MVTQATEPERAQATVSSTALAWLGSALALLFGAGCYLLFLGTFVYFAGFVENMGVPAGIDAGGTAFSGSGLMIDIMLLGLFAAQHSVMARSGFKALWTRIVPRRIERSLYVFLSSLTLLLLCWQWRPIPGVVWQVDNLIGQTALVGLSLMGWLLVVISSFLIDHFDLLGVRQVYLAWRRKQYTNLPFRANTLYRLTRHPMMLGFLIAFWAAPRMTLGHLLFALVMTGYILVAVRFLEERDLVANLGAAYVDYQRRVPMLIPFIRQR